MPNTAAAYARSVQHEATSGQAELPRGTVTMMFTDIEGSTALLGQHGALYADLLQGHRALVHDVVARHDGVVVDTQGDAFFVAFARASDAAAAAVSLGDALEHAGPARVRIGLHTGEPTLSAGGYVGMDVHRAARISAAAHGGQTVVSQQTRDLLEDAPVRDLGSHRLKDVGEVRLFQLGEGDFPPLRSLALTNLHGSPDLVGRSSDADAVIDLLTTGSRLVTVTGAGGIGKTSLARYVAWRIRDRFPDGTWFVDLSHVTDPSLVLPELAAALSSPADVVAHLLDRRLLLVLDNLEQVLEAAPVVAELVTRCPRLAVIATSREPLRVQAEREYPLEPLEPPAGAELFRRQALAVAPRFDAPDDLLVELSMHLDGLPLAIELAAARSRVLAPSQLRARLDRRLPLLVGGARDAPQRHRTIEATIAWSYDLLDPLERRLLAALAVFAGEWELEAAEEICGCSLDQLQALVDKNLVHAADGRFRMLETIREFAGERLVELPDCDTVRRRHAGWYLDLVDRLREEFVGARQEQALDQLGREYANLRAAMQWCASAGDDRDAAHIAAGLPMFWFIRGLYDEGVTWLQRFVDAPGVEPIDRARQLWGLGLLSTLTGRPDAALTYLAAAEEMARELADRVLLERVLLVRGLLAFFADDMHACRLTFEQSIELARETGDTWCLADGLGTIGSIYPLMGEHRRALAAGTEALSIARASRDMQGTRMALFALALVAVREGELGAAREASEEGLEICRGLGDLWFVSYFEWIFSTACRLAGDVGAAHEHAAEALRVARQLEAPLLLVCALEASAAAARCIGDQGAALAYLREAEAVGRAGGVPGSYVSEVLRASAELAAEAGDSTRAASLASEAVKLARTVGDSWAERRAADQLASIAG
jgi:predicted ATPase/class 3 adenylate cyclase